MTHITDDQAAATADEIAGRELFDQSGTLTVRADETDILYEPKVGRSGHYYYKDRGER